MTADEAPDPHAPHDPHAPDRVESPDLAAAQDAVELSLLGEAPRFTNAEVAERAGVPLELATELWRLMGFAQADDDEVAFTEADVVALQRASELVDLGILSAERQSALVRTWGRSFARLAEWQTSLLATVALEQAAEDQSPADAGAAAAQRLSGLSEEVLPRVEELQSYVWRRHLLSASARLMTTPDPAAAAHPQAVCFVDIVGYTTRSRSLDDAELVAWLEGFESRVLDLVVAAGGRIIKNIGDEVLFVTDDVDAALRVALELSARGADEDDDFPEVRAGIAYGEVVLRLGDVFGPTVNLASRLTSASHRGTVLVDRGAHDEVRRREPDPDGGVQADGAADPAYTLKRVPRITVKGYSRLAAWVARPRDPRDTRERRD